MRKFSIVLALALSVLFVQAAAASLVANGGFESGDFSGWTISPLGDTTWLFVDNSTIYPPVSGAYSASFGAPYYADDARTIPNPPNIISQTIGTTSGQYFLRFWLANRQSGGTGFTPNSVVVDWGGVPIWSATDLGESSWGQQNFLVTATGPTTLTFYFHNENALFQVDDVSVSPVPIPGSLVLLASALLPLGWRRLRKG